MYVQAREARAASPPHRYRKGDLLIVDGVCAYVLHDIFCMVLSVEYSQVAMLLMPRERIGLVNAQEN